MAATCAAGHEWTEENTYEWNDHRYCRACRRTRSEQHRAAKAIVREPRRACEVPERNKDWEPCGEESATKWGPPLCARHREAVRSLMPAVTPC